MYDVQPLSSEAAALPSPEEKKWLAVEERSSPEFSIGKKVQVGCEVLRGSGVAVSLYTQSQRYWMAVWLVRRRRRGFIVICVGENWLNEPLLIISTSIKYRTYFFQGIYEICFWRVQRIIKQVWQSFVFHICLKNFSTNLFIYFFAMDGIGFSEK